MPALDLHVRRLGRQPYERVWHAMQKFTDKRHSTTTDELWLVEHDPVFTLGRAGKPEHLLAAGDVPVVYVDRGGQVTYHGPGQLVAYVLFDLRRLGLSVRELVHGIEEAVIQMLKSWHIQAERQAGAPGIYVDKAKIMALGLRVRRGCSFHGLALNVAMNLRAFSQINPCGHPGLSITQVLDCGGPDQLDEVASTLVIELANTFGLKACYIEQLPDEMTQSST